MAAIIDFPTEAAYWRRRNESKSDPEPTCRGKILIFSGVRYNRRTDDRRKPVRTDSGAKGAEG